MRTSHLYLFGVAFATIGVIAAAPAAAQMTQVALQEDGELTSDQQAEFSSWPAQQQGAYELWPAETKAYFWSLTPPRQLLFWRLTDEDKIALTAMTGPERDAAWGQIESRAVTPSTEGAPTGG